MPGPSSPDSWLDRMQKTSFELLVTVVALVLAWQLLRHVLVPLVVIAVLIFVIRLALCVVRRSRWQ
jgi:hypothetical protein